LPSLSDNRCRLRVRRQNLHLPRPAPLKECTPTKHSVAPRSKPRETNSQCAIDAGSVTPEVPFASRRETPLHQATATFLVVDDEASTARALTRVLERAGPSVVASSVAEARQRLCETRWAGMVIDLHLQDGSGLDVLRFAREHGNDARAILLSGALEPGAINGAFALGAKCLCKPCPIEHLTHFAREAILEQGEIPTRLTRAVSELAARHSLTPAQTEIVLSTVQGIDRATIVASRRVSENTHKTQVRGILRKTRTLSLGELRDRVLRSVVGAASGAA
jgi:DNA-binding NarL/FixJ family response regulator